MDAWHRQYQVKRRKYSRKTTFWGTSRWLNWHKTKNIVKSKKATYRFREDMSWNIIGRFGRFLRMFGDMQTGLKKRFRCRKDQNSATIPCDPRAVISLIVTHYQAQFTEIIRFGSVCAHTCRGMSIDRSGRSSLRDRPPARFRCSSRELADRSYLPRCGKRGDCLQIGEKNNE